MRYQNRGRLTLIESKNPPVFGTDPIEITFTIRPKVGEAFLFQSNRFGFCNTSDIKTAAIDSETGDYLLTTRNSLYRLEVLPQPKDDDRR